MRVYYINLEKNKENRDEMKRLFPSAERLEGVDGTKLNVQDIYPFCVDKNWRDPHWNRRFTKGEVGCVLSHFKLWKKCIELEEPVLILEDDVVPLDPLWKEKCSSPSI